jgi:isocitrate dehydrogenase kinase/phosphatase
MHAVEVRKSDFFRHFGGRTESDFEQQDLNSAGVRRRKRASFYRESSVDLSPVLRSMTNDMAIEKLMVKDVEEHFWPIIATFPRNASHLGHDGGPTWESPNSLSMARTLVPAGNDGE